MEAAAYRIGGVEVEKKRMEFVLVADALWSSDACSSCRLPGDVRQGWDTCRKKADVSQVKSQVTMNHEISRELRQPKISGELR